MVLSTLHTIDAGQSIGRILGLFDLAESQQIRLRLAETLRWIVSQRLVPRTDGGRQLVLETMGNNLRTKEAVALGEDEARNFYDIITASETFGWVTFDRSVINAYKAELITEDVAMAYSTKKGLVQREIDLIKKTRGEAFEQSSGLKMDKLAAARV